jgi:DNA-binding NarL/FixJ family response regulator
MVSRRKSFGDRSARILIVDDHPMMREGLAARIGRQQDMEICGEADNAGEALKQVKNLQPDLVIVDITLVDSMGIDLIKDVAARYPNVKMLVVSAFEESLYAERSLRAGAHGYINKREVQEKIVEALRTVLSGETYLSPQMTQRMLSQAIKGKRPAEQDPVERLSNRELEVFRLIGQGKATGEIARLLHLSVHTIDTHREKIRHKLDITSGQELMQKAVQWVLENT